MISYFLYKLFIIFKNNNNNYYLFYSDKIYTDLQIVLFSNFNTVISYDKIDNISRCIQCMNINLTMM